MDFHCLARKELQFLCKKNKIPANITNVAMAEALEALELVEGLEELQSQSQSTRSTIRTQKTTRKTRGVEEENKSLEVTEIEVKDQKKSSMVETPLPSGRRRPGVGSTRSKVEGTRRSVRLLEKCMTGLSIKESEKKPVKVGEMGEVGSNKSKSGATSELPLARNLSASLEDEREFSDGVEETSKCNNGESNEKTDELEGSDGNAISQDSINFSMESAGTIDGNLNEALVVDVTKSIEELVANVENVPEEVADHSEDMKAIDVVDETKSIELVANVEDVPEEVTDHSSSADMEAIDYVVDETNSTEVLVSNVVDVPEEVADHSSSADMEAIHDDPTILHVDETKSLEVLVTNVRGVPEEVAYHSSPAADKEAIHDDILPKAEEHADGKVPQNDLVLSAEGPMDSSAEKGNEESNVDDAYLGDSCIDDDTGSDSKSLADGLQGEVSCEQKSRCIPTAAYNSESPRTMDEESDEDDIDYEDTEIEESDGNSDIDYDTGSDSKSLPEDPMINVVDEESDEDDIDYEDTEIEESDGNSDIDYETGSDSKSLPEDPMINVVDEESDEDDIDHEDTEIEESDGNSDIDYDTGSYSKSLPEDPMINVVDEEALVDTNVTEAKMTPVSSFHTATQSVVSHIQVQQLENYDGGSEALINVCVMPSEEFAEASLKTTSMPSPSPLRAQFSEQSKPSNKKQTTIPKTKVTQVLDKLNNENIVEKEVEPCLRKAKKNVLDKETMQKLEGLSLRKLNQMFKELQINEKMKNKEDNKQPSGKRRPALQMLTQNSMKSEDEKQN